MKPGLDRLRDLAPLQDADLRSTCLDSAREKFVQGARARRPRTAVALLAAAALAFAALLLVSVWPSSGRLTFSVGTADGRVGAWIAAGQGEAVPLRFSDGTSVVLQPAARARVVASDARGARVLLESGALHASVTHTGTSAWSFDAGPFEVEVTGTRFELQWDPTEQRLHLDLIEGSVVVAGSCLPERRAMTAGQSLEVFCKEQRALLTDSTVAPASSGAQAIDAPAALPTSSGGGSDAANGPTAPASGSAGPPSARSGASPSTWRDLMAASRYDEAMRAAEAEGFDVLIAQGSAKDLLALADVARFAGKTARATQALTAVRKRYAGSSESARAAFHLGRLAFDQRGAHAEAAKWFSTYLAEQSGGGLAQEALGRLIECHEALGASGEAREAARRYLAAYPNGPHAERAQSLLAAE